MSEAKEETREPSAAICPVGLEEMSTVGQTCNKHYCKSVDRSQHYQSGNPPQHTHQRNLGPTTF